MKPHISDAHMAAMHPEPEPPIQSGADWTAVGPSGSWPEYEMRDSIVARVLESLPEFFDRNRTPPPSPQVMSNLASWVVTAIPPRVMRAGCGVPPWIDPTAPQIACACMGHCQRWVAADEHVAIRKPSRLPYLRRRVEQRVRRREFYVNRWRDAGILPADAEMIRMMRLLREAIHLAWLLAEREAMEESRG